MKSKSEKWENYQCNKKRKKK